MDPHPWHVLREPIDSRIVAGLDDERQLGGHDVVVATAWQVVPLVDSYSHAMGRKVYFLQDYESYMLGGAGTRKAIAQTFDVPWPLVVTSGCIARLVGAVANRSVATVPCAVEHDLFRLTMAIESDERRLIGFPARSEPAKRTHDAVQALDALRPLLPGSIGIWSFGPDAWRGRPNWAEHFRSPDNAALRDLYNRTLIFLVPSVYEGFGLPGVEAMACGAALVSTRNGGVDDYATDGESALLCEPVDHTSLFAATARLLADDPLRVRIASHGAAATRWWTWANAARRFEEVLVREALGDPLGRR